MYDLILSKSFENFLESLWIQNMLSRQFLNFFDQIYISLLCNGNLEIHVWIVHRRQLNFLFISMT
jgi:hypothetical protein